MADKFDFYEVVKIVTENPETKHLHGLEGVIMGISEGEDGNWYAVHPNGFQEGWFLSENELVSTGRKMKREDFYDGSTIRVLVDPNTGEGRIAE